jgi:PAS domain S-box-containing protein
MIPPTGTAKRDGKLNGNNPTSLFQDDRGRIWVSTFREFGYLEDGRFTTIKGIPEGNKPSIAQDTAGNVWVIDSYVGLFQISPQNEVREIPWADLGHKDDASVLAADRRQGGVWIGFSQGGIAYFSDGQVRATYTTTDGLGAGRVRDLQFGDDGALWVSTERGLSRLMNNRIATMTSKNGLPCDAVQWAMEEDDRSLWLDMACGLVRIARSELDAWVADPNRAIQATVFDSSDGVRSTLLIGVSHPQVARTPDGSLWFVTGDGVSVIDTLHLHRNDLPPPVHIEQIIADHKTYWQNLSGAASSSPPRLPPLVRDLEIDYTALSLVAPEKVRFRVKLEGWDRDWKDAGNERKAFYSNLPPRKYRFRVMACNNSGLWNEAGDSLDFSIVPAYWQTNWFRMSCVVALALLLWMIYTLRVRSIQLHSNQLALINSKLETQIVENADLYSDLQRSEAYLAEAQRLTHTGSGAWSVPGWDALYLSEEWYRIYGFDPKQGLAAWEDRLQRMHPEDQARVQEAKDRATVEKLDYEVDHRIVLPDGTVKHTHTVGHPVLNASGDVEQFVCTMVDVTERKQAEEALRNAFEEIKGLRDQLYRENLALKEEIDQSSMFEEIVGTSPAIRAVLSRVSKVAPTDSTVLISGETGTGKELIARAIHKRSQRSTRAFISVNCAAIPRDLIASELFGHEKGAFTGAVQRRIGRFELAEGGTLFLDEIGELPPETQITLLRVLQEREFERVGGTASIRANVRVIAATNRDLQAVIASNAFRSDLFYRLNVFPIEVPPLRERREDIPLLVAYFIDRFARKSGKSIRSVNKKTLELLQSYSWPGNIRELQNVIERSVIVCDTENFSVDESWLSPQVPRSAPKIQHELSRTLANEEKEMIETALRESRGRVSGPLGAAAKLGIPGSTLDSKIRSLKIDKNRFKSTDHPTDRT